MAILRKKWVRIVGVLGILGLAVFLTGWTEMGGDMPDGRQAELGLSPNWRDGQFRNINTRATIDLNAAMASWLGEEPAHSTPEQDVPILRRTAADFATPPQTGLRVTWLGHSSTLVEIDGYRVLIDPVWGDRASPFDWAGPQRFHDAPIALEDLPALDAIVISHDHYDHLDYDTIRHFVQQRVHFIVPLGVGTHLQYWGVDKSRITELDWWQEHTIGDLRFTATPARHQSGRTMAASATWQTLWAGWAIRGSDHAVYFSGDTSMFPGMATIGERLGPFDVTLIDSGAYNQLWADNHLGPEQAVESHQLVGGKLMIPVHWGTFYLAPHTWVEPVERVIAAAQKAGAQVATPRPGESIEPELPMKAESIEPGQRSSPFVKRWWPNLPWRRAEDYPIVSSGLGEGEGKTK